MSVATRDITSETIVWAAVLSALLGLLSQQVPGWRETELKGFDLFSAVTAPKTSGEVAVVGIDGQAIQSIGPWPWPRTVHAKLVDELTGANVKAIFFDLLFEDGAEGDDVFAAALARSRRVALASTFKYLRGGRVANELGEPNSVLSRAAPLGFVHVEPDADGVVRRMSSYKDSAWAVAVRLSGREVTHNLEGNLIRYPREAIDVIPYQEALSNPRMLANRVVIVGLTQPSPGDPKLPFKIAGEAERVTTTLVQALSIDTSIRGAPIHAPAWWVASGLMAVALLLASLVTQKTGNLLAGSLISASSLVGASLAIFLWPGVWLPMLSSLLALLAFPFLAIVLRMITERGRMKRSLSGQVSPRVMEALLRGSINHIVGGRSTDICVLFSDIRDFTALCEGMPAARVTTLLQKYFDRMVPAIHKNNGTVDKFTGDGIMALFGAPLASPNPCVDAVKCSLAMLTELDALNNELVSEGHRGLTIGIGLSYGEAIVGNIGSTARHNFSAIGDPVNVAARVEGLTKFLGRKILVTDAVVKRAQPDFEFESLGVQDLKGHSALEIWGIRDQSS